MRPSISTAGDHTTTVPGYQALRSGTSGRDILHIGCSSGDTMRGVHHVGIEWYALAGFGEPEEVSVPFGTSYIVKTIRLLPIEDSIFDRACDALGDLERAQLMQEAVLFETFRLGIRYSDTPPPPLTAPWPFLPERGGVDVTSVRVSISMRVTVAELMSIAAEHVKASETLFIVGSTLAYVGRLQSCYRGRHAESPESARESRAALRKIRLPSQYHYRGER